MEDGAAAQIVPAPAAEALIVRLQPNIVYQTKMSFGTIKIELLPVLTDVARFDAATKEAARLTNRGPEWRCLVAQSAIAGALAGASLDRAGPEHVGWVQILVRAFHCLEGARALLSRSADIAAQTLLRVASEIRLHQILIRLPWEKHLEAEARKQESNASDAWLGVRDRLRAYAAWAIASDLDYAKARSQAEELAGLFRPTLPAELPNSASEAGLLTFVFGEMAVLSEQEARMDQERVKSAYEDDVKRLELWLGDARLAQWAARLAAIRKRRKQDWVTDSFGELFDDKCTSFRQSLVHLAAKHEYAFYARSSRLIHGNTIDLLTAARLFEPGQETRLLFRFLPDEADAAIAVTDIANTLCQVAFMMWAMRDHVLASAKDRNLEA